MLLFGHNRHHRDRLWPGGAARVLEEAGSRVTSAAELPALIGAPPLVWDRLLRRGTVTPFPDGHYDEVPVAQAALMTARRVAVLPRECVTLHRRHTLHPSGSPGAGHFDLFEQYARSFGLLERTPAASVLRPHLFTRMIRHFLFVFDLAGCVDRTQRPQFFQRASEYYRSYLPGGYQRPDGREGLKFSLLAGGAYAAFEVAKLSHIARGAVTGRR